MIEKLIYLIRKRRRQMKTSIKDVRIYSAVSTLSKPIADATHDISKISFYVLEVELESGVTGQGYLLSFHYSPNAIEGALKISAAQFVRIFRSDKPFLQLRYLIQHSALSSHI